MLNPTAPLRQHWQRLTRREQQAILVLGLFIGLVLAWLLVWQPQQQALRDAERRYQDELQLQIDLGKLPAPSTMEQSERVDASALPGFLARTGADAGITIERMDSEGAERISLSLTGTLDSLLGWLEILESSRVAVNTLSMEVSPNAEVKVQLLAEAH